METYTSPNLPVSQLQEELDKARNQKMPINTLFGNLNNLVPRPYSKFETMDNPKLS